MCRELGLITETADLLGFYMLQSLSIIFRELCEKTKKLKGNSVGKNSLRARLVEKLIGRQQYSHALQQGYAEQPLWMHNLSNHAVDELEQQNK